MDHTNRTQLNRIPADIETHLGWRFETLLEGSFRRSRKTWQQDSEGNPIEFPVIGPRPPKDRRPAEGRHLSGPFIYFVVDSAGHVCYVGKSQEESVLKRWIRPGQGGAHEDGIYWTHATKTGGCVRAIAEGLRTGRGPYELRFVPSSHVPAQYRRGLDIVARSALVEKEVLSAVEATLIADIRPQWNPHRGA